MRSPILFALLLIACCLVGCKTPVYAGGSQCNQAGVAPVLAQTAVYVPPTAAIVAQPVIAPIVVQPLVAQYQVAAPVQAIAVAPVVQPIIVQQHAQPIVLQQQAAPAKRLKSVQRLQQRPRFFRQKTVIRQ